MSLCIRIDVIKAWVIVLAALLLGACNGGSSSDSGGGYAVSGTIAGLDGRLVLQNNGGGDLTRLESGGFTFATLVAGGSAYQVTVLSQPSGQACTVTNGSGTVGVTNVTNVLVTCTDLPPPGATFTIGGTISGLSASGTIVLQNNGGNNLSRSVNGGFAFTDALADGDSHAVTVLTQPVGQTCEVANGTGTVSGADVTDVAVTCTNNTYPIGGTVAGLGGTVVLRNNGGDDLELSENGPFTFATEIASGSAYAVSVHIQPDGQTCTVANGSGTVGSAAVANVTITCAGETYTVGGTISGLTGTVVLRNNGGDDLPLSGDGAFAFAMAIADGSPYSVTIFSQPSGQRCTVENGSDIVDGADVIDVEVICADLVGLMVCFNPDFYLKNSTTYTARYRVRRHEPQDGFYDVTFGITETREVLGAASFNGEDNAIQVKISSVGEDIGVAPVPPGFVELTDEPDDFTGEFMAYYTADPAGEVRYLGATRDVGAGHQPYELADPYERLVFDLEPAEFVEQTFTLTTNGAARVKETVWTYEGEENIDVPAGSTEVCKVTGTGHEPSLLAPTPALSDFEISYAVGTGIPVRIEYMHDNTSGGFPDVAMDMQLIEATIDGEPVH